MSKISKSKIKKILPLFLFIFIILSFAFFIFISFFIFSSLTPTTETSNTKNYHIMVIGQSANEHFLKELYSGANKFNDTYNAVIELYIPTTEAENSSMQPLFDYAAYANVDGIIAYIDSTEETIKTLHRTDLSEIPVVTTGQYSPKINQITFIGNSSWELGKIIADETSKLINQTKSVFIINGEYNNNINYSNIITSFQISFSEKYDNSAQVLENSDILQEKITDSDTSNIVICLTEEDTIKAAQFVSENKDKKIEIIGFGNNETCKLYLDKQIISELIYLDPVKIGETAIKELFEYRNTGYANSYIAADVKILRSKL